MTVACIIIKNLPTQVEAARHSHLRGTPLVIYDEASPLLRVVDASPGWRIHPEMPLETALARCPNAESIPADAALYRQQWDSAIARLRNPGATVIDIDLGVAYALIDPRRRPLTDEPRIVADIMRCVPPNWEPRVGVASDRYAAHCAASIANPGNALRVPDTPDRRRAFLAPLPVNLLPVDVHILAALHDRGVHRLGHLENLSSDGIATVVSELDTAVAMQRFHHGMPRAA